MKASICALLFASSIASAAPFTSGQSMPPAGRGTRVPTPATLPAPTQRKAAAPKKAADKGPVQEYAENYFLKTYVPGAAGMRVMSAVATANDPVEMTGWPNKLRSTGTVELVIAYKGKEQRETRNFDAILENGRIVEFSTH